MAAAASTRLRGRSRSRPASRRCSSHPATPGTAREPGITNVAIDRDRRARRVRAQRAGRRLPSSVPKRRSPRASSMRFAPPGLKIFGPTRAAAQLESSKDYAKAFMARHGIPTAAYQTFTDVGAAHAYVDAPRRADRRQGRRTGRGKGVVVAGTRRRSARGDRPRCSSAIRWATPGARVVIEDCLAGEEASFIVMVDGRNVLPLASSQDHKRLAGRRPRTQHRWHGRLFAGAGRHARRCTRGSCATSSCPRSTAWPPTAFRTSDSSMRA